MNIIIDESLTKKIPELFTATRIIAGVQVGDTPKELQAQKESLVNEWRGKTESELAGHGEIIRYRYLQERLNSADPYGVPAVEGLLTRSLMQGTFPTINSAVDAANVISIKHMVPIGLFDADQVGDPVTLNYSELGDTIMPIGKGTTVDIPVNTPVLRDPEKLFSVVGVQDSDQTKVTMYTTNLLAFTWGSAASQSDSLNKALEELETLIRSYSS